MGHCNYKYDEIMLIKNKPSEGKTLNITFCFDNNFAMPCGVAITSVIKNNPNINLHFHLFSEDVSDDSLTRFSKIKGDNVSLTVYKIHGDMYINEKTLTQGLSKATCLRFLAPEIIDSSIERILYLDGDMICLDKLDGLLDLNLENRIAAVVEDLAVTQKKYELQTHLPPIDNYFNAGFMFINTIEWKKNNITEHCFEMINNGAIYKFADQDVLNILLNNKKLVLAREYNRIITLTPLKLLDSEFEFNSIIIHYTTENKPWYTIFESRIFSRYFNASPWSDFRLDEAPTATAFRLKAKKYLKENNYISYIKYYLRYLIKKHQN
ncbi:glycosyl transferase family 8 [Hafnia paralvei]|nr:glycosyl transferase family 8 [Hafnia paralvei]